VFVVRQFFARPRAGIRSLASLLVAAFGFAAASAQVVTSRTDFIDITRLLDPGYVTLENCSLSDIGIGPNGPQFRLNFNPSPSRFKQSFVPGPKDLSSQDMLTWVATNHSDRTVNLVILFQVTADPNNFNGSTAYQMVIPPGQSIRYLMVFDQPNPAQWYLRHFPRPFDTPYTQINVSTSFARGSIYHWRFSMIDALPASVTISDFSTLVMRRDLNGVADEFFQYAYRDWPDKIHTVADFFAQKMAEQADLGLNPPQGEYEGTNSLPNQGPSDRWRIAQVNGKYYFIHPSGRPFWSFGLHSLHDNTATWFTGREFLFQNIPSPTGPDADCYGETTRPPNFGGQTVTTFKVVRYNLKRKFGPNYEAEWRDLCRQRIKSWGFNTVASFAQDAFYDGFMPYTIALDTFDYPNTLTTPNMHWRKMVDPYFEDFELWMTLRFSPKLLPHNNRANFIGVFVDNELSWGHIQNSDLNNRYSIAMGALAAPYTQPAKRAFVAYLVQKYQSVGLLNQAWGTSFTSWSQVRNPVTFNANTMTKPMLADVKEYTKRFAGTYFLKVRRALENAGCTGLYLGCRFWYYTPEVVDAAAPYVDAYSFNNYALAPAFPWTYLGSLRKPVIVSEWSNPINARGSIGWSQHSLEENRAAIVEFFSAALAHPNFIGVHWYELHDSPVSGIAGSNWNIGFGVLDVCDTPKPEVVDALRQIGRTMYQIRR
jgi:hypothetical protein